MIQTFARFPLLRYFLATSFLAVAIVMALTAFLFVQFARESFASELESQNKQEAVHFSAIFYSDVWLPSKERIPGSTLQDIDPTLLEVFAQKTSFSLPIVQVSLLDINGTVLYSTDPSTVGASGAVPSGYQWTLQHYLPSSSLVRDQMLTATDGTNRQIDVTTTYSPLSDADPASLMEGEPLGVLEITRDITDKLAAAERTSITNALIGSGSMGIALVVLLFLIVLRADRIIGRWHSQAVEGQRLMAESNRRLEEALAELKQTQQSLIQQARLSALGQMASGIAHDFNNALVPILGFTELLLSRPENLADVEKTRNYLQMISMGAEDAATVVSRMREFYRKREENEEFSPVDLESMVSQAITLTQPKWRDQALMSGITITVETMLEEAGPISGNESELRQAVVNLILNAVDAMPEGGTITLRTRNYDGYGAIKISDTGVGMTEEVRIRCMEPFFTTKGVGGTGMGLAMVHGIAQRHDGFLDIESVEGQGTTFSIRLPIVAQSLPGPDGTDRKGENVRVLRILAVDDEPMALQVLSEFLEGEGHVVETAPNGREGLEAFRQGNFDVVITDWAMPEMSGDQLAVSIKDEEPGTPVILLSGFGDIIRSSGELPTGVDMVMSKPAKLDDLRQAMTALLARYGKPQ